MTTSSATGAACALPTGIGVRPAVSVNDKAAAMPTRVMNLLPSRSSGKER
ncbi:hypothetical protein ABT346_24040 [Micromonospora peucetia]